MNRTNTLKGKVLNNNRNRNYFILITPYENIY